MIDPDELEIQQPDADSTSPYWPCVYFTYRDEIVGTLFWGGSGGRIRRARRGPAATRSSAHPTM
jgi:hypothetical protein